MIYSLILFYLGRKHHARKKVLILGIKNGGLRMPGIFATIKVIKLMWIKRLLKQNNKYSLTAKQNSKIIDFQHYFSNNMSKEYLVEQPDKFYGEILDYRVKKPKKTITPNKAFSKYEFK